MQYRDRFDEELAQDPQDWELRLIYADWLEEQGDHEGALFERFAAEWRPEPWTHSDRHWWWDRPGSHEPLFEWLRGCGKHGKFSYNHRGFSHSLDAAYRDYEDTWLREVREGWVPPKKEKHREVLQP